MNVLLKSHDGIRICVESYRWISHLTVLQKVLENEYIMINRLQLWYLALFREKEYGVSINCDTNDALQ